LAEETDVIKESFWVKIVTFDGSISSDIDHVKGMDAVASVQIKVRVEIFQNENDAPRTVLRGRDDSVDSVRSRIQIVVVFHVVDEI
jgi:hypothetical protein